MDHLYFFKNKPTRSLVLFASFASAAFLSFALIGQYGFGLHPCELCILQRYPYALITVIGIAAFFLVKSERMLGYVAFLCGTLFLIDAGIAGYHAGVELGVFPGPSACTSNSTPGESLEEMRKAIMNAALVPCDQPMAHFLGLSMAAWNGITATLTAIFTFAMLRRIRRS